MDGHNCGYHHQWGQDKVNAAVEEVIYKLVNNPKFQEVLKAKVGAKTDTDELEKEREICRSRLRQTIGAIEDEIDTISMRIDNINKKQLSKDSIKDDNGNVQYLCAETIDDSYADTYLTLFCNFESEGSY